MTSGAAVAAVDWGTSSLRVWLLDSAGAALAEHRSDEGMQVARDTGFSVILERILSELTAASTLPVIVCGMAGARQGWVEAPYATVPATLKEVLAGAIRVPGIARDVRIVPGLAQRSADAPDVMRGEETQLAGAAAKLAVDAIVCLPGTHSKWVQIAGGKVTGFRTFLTGELFALLSTHSILRHSLDGAPPVNSGDPAFAEGVRRGLQGGGEFGSTLFSVRAGSLLLDRKPAEQAGMLSGLLIGAEIASADRLFGLSKRLVTLVASGRLADLYERASEIAGHGTHLVDADAAVRNGLFETALQGGMIA